MAFYSVNTYDIIDQAAFDAAMGAPGQTRIEEYGGRVLAIGAVTVVRGEWQSGRGTVVEWADEESFKKYAEASKGEGRPGLANVGMVTIPAR